MGSTNKKQAVKWLLSVVICSLLISLTQAATLVNRRTSDIANTRHNLGSGGPVNSSASSSEICVFCHTPHGADTSGALPLWNRTLSAETYDTYGADTLDALDAIESGANANDNHLPQPAGSSKLCLSCHDGTLAIGTSIINSP
ncbi:MAG: hypothetical protein V7752_10810, partial [Halopseudomonas sp.]